MWYLMRSIEIINILSDGNVHSGVEIGAVLGVSRTSVWKMMSHLKDYGIDVLTVKGKGYQLNDPINLLDLRKLKESIGMVLDQISDIEIFHKLESTNQYLMTKKILDKSKFQVCLAEMQTAGKGRRGKEWLSPYGQNIYLSIMFNIEGGIDSVSGLSLAVGVSISNALNKIGVVSTLKWPNDVFINGKKIAGILVELEGVSEDCWKVVVGVGVNVSMNELPKNIIIDQEWTSLSLELGKQKLDRNYILSVMLAELVRDITAFKLKGFDHFKKTWEDKDIFRGKEVQSLTGNIKGIGCGVDSSGALKIKTPSGIKLVSAGEVVSVRYAT